MGPKENVENCEKIFVSWTWQVIFITGFIVVASTIAWATAVKLTNIENKQTQQETDIQQLKKVYADVDTVKQILRQNHDLLIAKVKDQ